MVFNEIIDNSIVIIPSNFKSFLRNYKFINYKLNFKVFSKEDLKKELFGKKSDEIIGFLLKNSNYTFDFINTFLDYYFSNALIKKVFFKRKKEKKESTVIDSLFELKTKLDNSNLIKVDSSFKYLFLNKKVVIFGYTKKDIEIKRILKYLGVKKPIFLPLDYLPISKKNKENIGYFAFSTKEDELHYNLNLCASKINNNKDVVLIGSEEGLFYLKLFADSYGLKIDYKDKTLLDLRCIVDLIKHIDDEPFLNLVEKYIIDEDIKKTILILNKCYDFDKLKDKSSILKKVLSNIKLNKEHYTHELIFTSNLEFDDNKQYILSSCTSELFPNVYINNEMCDEETKKELGLTSALERNRLNKEIASLFVRFSNVISISTYLFNEKGEILPSFLFVEQKIKRLNNSLITNDYSLKVSKLFYSRENYIYKKFFEKSDYYKLYSDYFKNLDSYNHKYKQIKNYKPIQMEFSYSSLNDYFECPFRFYLSRVLNLDSFEDTFSTKAGNFAHKVFENIYKSNFDIDKEIMDNLPFYEFKNEEKYLLERFIINIKVCYELIKERIEDKNITKTYSEKKLKTTLKNGFIFKGTIDSIVETDNKNIFVIDYKSGSFKEFNENNFENNIGLQLPSYIYLIKNNSSIINNSDNICGLFIQPINYKDLFTSVNLNYKSTFKMEGRIIDDEEIIKSFDDSYLFNNESLYIKGLKKSNNKKTKTGVNSDILISKEEIENCYKELDKKLNEAVNNIENYKFDISPISKKSESIACTYCKYKAICFADISDFKPIKTE